nr:helix-turn-helix transcriptional regulator [Lacticaseibacillus parakribbianus]
MIKSMRASRRLTQKDLAEAAGLSLSSIQSYENGTREPKRQSMDAIMWALNQYPETKVAKRVNSEKMLKEASADKPKKVKSVDLATDDVAYSWKRKALTSQQISTMRTVVKSMVEPEEN